MDGTNFLFSFGAVTINGTTSQSLETSIDMIETTTKDSSGHKTYQAGEDGGTVTVEGKIDTTATYSITDLRTAAAAKASIVCVYGEGINTTGGRLLTFNGLISGLSETGPQNAEPTWSVTVQITGAIDETVGGNVDPVVANELPDLELETGFDAVVVDLTDVFTDADDDALTYSAVSGTEATATVGVVSADLTITEAAAGTSLITVTADDGSDGTVDATFTVTVNEA